MRIWIALYVRPVAVKQRISRRPLGNGETLPVQSAEDTVMAPDMEVALSGERSCVQELIWAARAEMTRHAALDCFR
jgi:hypothetical protein